MTKVFHLQEWTPEVAKTAMGLIGGIHSLAPELEILFMGAAALGLPGKNDIDLDILCSTKDMKHYTTLLSSVLGKPKKTTSTTTTWQCIQNNFEVDCILSDPVHSHVSKQRKMFEYLKTNEHLRKDYEKLKRNCDGLPYDEYERQKQAFFTHVWTISKPSYPIG